MLRPPLPFKSYNGIGRRKAHRDGPLQYLVEYFIERLFPIVTLA